MFWLVNPKTKSNTIFPLNMLPRRQGIRWPCSLRGSSWIWHCLNLLDHWKLLAWVDLKLHEQVARTPSTITLFFISCLCTAGVCLWPVDWGGKTILSMVYKWVCMKSWYYLKRTDTIIQTLKGDCERQWWRKSFQGTELSVVPFGVSYV